MQSLLQMIMSPIISLSLLMFANGYFTSYISVRMTTEGYGANTIGFVHSAYYAGFMLGAIYVERLIARVRHIQAFAIFASLCTSLFLVQGMFIHPVPWMFSRFLAGVSIASLYIVIESWFLLIADEHSRGKILAIYMVALYGSQACSQFVLNLLPTLSLYPFLFAACICSLSVIPVAFSKGKIPEMEYPSFKEITAVLKKTSLGLMSCFLAGLILTSIYSFTPVFAERNNLPVAEVLFFTMVGGLILQWPIGRLSDTFDRRKILTGISVLLVVPVAVVYLYPGIEGYVLIASFILGGLAFTIYPVGIALACDKMKPSMLVTATSVLLLVYSVGSVVGPLVAPFFMDYFGSEGLYLYIGVLGVGLALFGLVQISRKEPVPEEEQSQFVPLPRVTSVAYELLESEEPQGKA